MTVITTLTPDGRPAGLTVNSFKSVSCEPAPALRGLARSAFRLGGFLAAEHFVVNTLSRGQETLSRRFSRALADKWPHLRYETGDSGCPLLPGGVADCDWRRCQTVEGGDHLILLGELLRLRTDLEAEPLLFLRGSLWRLP